MCIRDSSPDELSVFRIIGIMNKDRRFLFLFYSYATWKREAAYLRVALDFFFFCLDPFSSFFFFFFCETLRALKRIGILCSSLGPDARYGSSLER